MFRGTLLISCWSIALLVVRVQGQEDPPFVGQWKPDRDAYVQRLQQQHVDEAMIEATWKTLRETWHDFGRDGSYRMRTATRMSDDDRRWTIVNADNERRVFTVRVAGSQTPEDEWEIRVLGADSIEIAIAAAPQASLRLVRAENSEQAATLRIGGTVTGIDVSDWLFPQPADPVSHFKPEQVYVVSVLGPPRRSGEAALELLDQWQSQHLSEVVFCAVFCDEPDVVREWMNQVAGSPEPADGGSAVRNRRLSLNHLRIGADPDLSTKEQLALPFNDSRDPISFIIGRTQQLEWLGPTAEVAEVLPQVLANRWNRDEFERDYAQYQVERDEFNKLHRQIYRSRDAQANLAAVEAFAAKLHDPRVRDQLKLMRFKALLAANDPRTRDYLLELQRDIQFTPQRIPAVVVDVQSTLEVGKIPVADEVVTLTMELAETCMETIQHESLALLNYAKLHQYRGNLDRALELAERSASASPEGPLPYHRQYLRELKREIRNRQMKDE